MKILKYSNICHVLKSFTKKNIKNERLGSCRILPSPVVTRDVCELEACLTDIAETILCSYITARDACRYSNEVAKETMDIFSYKKLLELCDVLKERELLVKEHIANAKAAKKTFNDLFRYIDCGCSASQERLEISRQLASDYQTKHERVRIEFQLEYDKAKQYDAIYSIVKPKLDDYVMQLRAMYPKINFEDEHPDTASGDIDYLLVQHYKWMMKSCKEFMEADSSLSARVNRGYKGLYPDEKEREAKATEGETKARARFTTIFTEKENEMKKRNEAELQAKLAVKQKEFEDTLADRLEEAEKVSIQKLNKKVKKKVGEAKAKLAQELKEMADSLNAVQEKLDEHLRAERAQKRCQKLYAAGLALLRATQKRCQRIDVNKELKLLEENSGEDEGDLLVSTVLNAIPREVWDKGIVPESVLRKRYHSMEAVALKVAMIEAEGGPLPHYWFSWLQYMVLMKPYLSPTTIPQIELDVPLEEPFEDLDTFDLMQRANYFVEQGNLGRALRFVDALKGASRGAAEAWYRDANAHMQTRQAAVAIMAHACALGLQYV